MERAKALAEKGYLLRTTDSMGAQVVTDKAMRYRVDPVKHTCTCWCFKSVGFCKHVLGLKELAKHNYQDRIAEAHDAVRENKHGEAFQAIKSAETLFRWAARVNRAENPKPKRRPRRNTSKNDRQQGKLLLNINDVFPSVYEENQAA